MNFKDKTLGWNEHKLVTRFVQNTIIDTNSIDVRYLKDGDMCFVIEEGRDYIFSNGGWDLLNVNGGLSFIMEYVFNASIVEPPTGSQIRFDNSIQNLVTKLWITHTSSLSVDTTKLFPILEVGTRLRIQDKDDHTKYQIYELLSPAVDKVNYSELEVQWLEGGIDIPEQRVIIACLSPKGNVDINLITETI